MRIRVLGITFTSFSLLSWVAGGEHLMNHWHVKLKQLSPSQPGFEADFAGG